MTSSLTLTFAWLHKHTHNIIVCTCVLYIEWSNSVYVYMFGSYGRHWNTEENDYMYERMRTLLQYSWNAFSVLLLSVDVVMNLELPIHFLYNHNHGKVCFLIRLCQYLVLTPGSFSFFLYFFIDHHHHQNNVEKERGNRIDHWSSIIKNGDTNLFNCIEGNLSQ